jgi:hypothetical protein
VLGSTGIAVAQGTGSAGNSGTAEGRNTPGQSDARPAPGEQKSVGARVVIAPEQQTAIKQYVVQEKIRPHKLSSRVTVGATLPADVELAPVPETWGTSFRSYRYVYTGDDVVLVDPSSRRVVE